MRPVITIVSAFIIGLAVGCGGSQPGEDINDPVDITLDNGTFDAIDIAADEGRDTATENDGGIDALSQDTADVGDPCAQTPMGFGCICDINQDCESGYCIKMPHENYLRCTRLCSSKCPEGWECSQVLLGGGDSAYACMPDYNQLCQSECSENSQCTEAGALCIQYGNKKYCGQACKQDSDCESMTRIKDCDNAGDCSFNNETTVEECLEDDLTCEVIELDFACVEATSIDGTTISKQCVPTSNHCECASTSDYQNDVNHCGDCETRCFYPNATASCSGGKCKMDACLRGYVNLNGLPDDGCEYECLFQSTVDHPDPQYIDANCDGIDGDAEAGVFVMNGGDDDNFIGSMEVPFATIGAAMAFAAEQSPIPEVYVSKGIYQEQVNLVNGVSVYGGYDGDSGWKRNLVTNQSIISWNGQESLAVRAVVARNITEPTTFDGFHVKSSQSSQLSGSSYGMHVMGCDEDLVISNNYLEADSGTQGGNGSFGTNGQAGSNGTKGSDAFVYDGCGLCVCTKFDFNTNMKPGPGGSSPCSMNGGQGGTGGKLGKGGTDGTTAVSGGGAGGAGAPDEQTDGVAGKPGPDGNDGADGESGIATGSISAGGLFIPLTGGSGSNGDHGKGGGGGGGGGGDDDAAIFGAECYSAGGAGGGGGGGGCGGTAGSGGGGGGGSFGLFVVNSSPVIRNNTLKSWFGGRGGVGGTGGAGGDGGQSGAGGARTADGAGAGAAGGKGGNGGDGGDGGGGPGGPTFPLYIVGSSSNPTCETNEYMLVGLGGDGGFSGGSGSTKGQTGQSGSIFGITSKCSLQ